MSHDDVVNRFRTLAPEARGQVLRALQTESRQALESIPRRHPQNSPVCLALAQHRLWLISQLRPDNRAYNEVIAFNLIGSLAIPAVQQSLDEIVRRHEPLRTTFYIGNGAPHQFISPPSSVPINSVDLTVLDVSSREARLQALVDDEQNCMFVLSQGPLIRVHLVRMAPESHVLLICAHHIVLDGWSVALFQQEFAVFYSAFERGDAPSIPLLPISYGDFAAWQSSALPHHEIERQIQYWRCQLSGVPPSLNLSIAKPRPEIESFRGARRFFSFDSDLSRKLRALSTVEGVTLFMMLGAGFYALLYRFSGESDITAGSVFANRKRAEIESLIGCFVNTIALRVKVLGTTPFRDFVRQFQRTAVAAYDNSDVPFEAVVDAVQPERSPARNPLVQILFVLQNTPTSPTVAPIDISVRRFATSTAKVDLVLSIDDNSDGLEGYLEYNTDLFEADAAELLLASYETILRAVVENVDLPIDVVPLLSAPVHDAILEKWSRGEPTGTPESCLDSIERQARRTPNAAAVTACGKTLSYAELNRRANEIAAQICACGVGRDDIIGVLLPRSVDLVASLLGILKAGTGYVTLDPSWPAGHLEWRATDAGVKLLLANAATIARAPSTCPSLVVDGPQATAAPRSEATLWETRPGRIAYVMYTSGSTGNPKGVVVTRENLDHSTTARCLHYLEPVTAFLHLSPFSFDSSVAGLFWTLVQGGHLVIPSNEAIHDVGELNHLIKIHRISHLLTVPSFYSMLLDTATFESWNSVRVAIVAGEQCPPSLLAKHHAKLPITALYNEYGPTEATVWCTAHRCDGVTADRVPIGRPIPFARMYILDEHRHIVPVGVPGEIWVGGAGVAAGYLNHPELTAERFFDDPFEPRSNARVYRTGDIGRYLRDGSIEMLGRRDRQVKVRGFRVELDGIEAVLLRHPSILDAAVTVSADDGGNTHILAWVESFNSSKVTAEELRTHLDSSLLPHERPARIHLMPRLPRLPNGKVDRSALAKGNLPAVPQLDDDGWTHLEQSVAQVCAKVFRCPQLSRDDNFFAAGADSLLIIIAFNELRAMTGANFTITDMFKYPTVRKLSAVLESKPVTHRI